MLPLGLLSPAGLSSSTISVRMCVPAVIDIDDARFLVAMQDYFLTTCGQHVVGECSFCVTVTRALTKYKSSKECFRQSAITS